MKIYHPILTLIPFAVGFLGIPVATQAAPPLGPVGQFAEYSLEEDTAQRDSMVETFSLVFGTTEERGDRTCQWLHLAAGKVNSEEYRVRLLCDRYPARSLEESAPSIERYLFQDSHGEWLEYVNRRTGEPVLPSLGAWEFLIPHAVDSEENTVFPPDRMQYLGHTYRRVRQASEADLFPPEETRTFRLLPDLWIGVAHNSRQKDPARRWDDSDYELVRLTRSDYEEMIEAGMTCFRVDAEQKQWLRNREVFYWGVGGKDIDFPESLYRSNYLGPTLFLDEPAVGTRDHVVRPRLREDPLLRRQITPRWVYEKFQELLAEKKQKGSPTSLIKGLRARPDVDLGNMDFRQQNLYTWETMIASAAYQMGGDGDPVPSAIVFEPPGHVGTSRTLPEMDMAYGCQIPPDDPANLTGILFGFLRGAARLSGRAWGTSIYGSVSRSDAPWMFTRAYDLGATRFFFWDSHRLACVPYPECLALARHLRNHADTHPHRDLAHLRQAAEVAVLLPPGYNLGHVHMGRGNLWGLGELNLERTNRLGVRYRDVMKNFFTEVERCLRLGIEFDLLWDLPNLSLEGYREIVRVREDGQVEIRAGDSSTLLEAARTPPRPGGEPPELDIDLSTQQGKSPLAVTARARVTERSAPVYYTLGTFPDGVFRNVVVCWELYGPGEEDYEFLLNRERTAQVSHEGGTHLAEIRFTIDRPGRYTLRASTVDRAGRTEVQYREITVSDPKSP